MSHIGHPQDAFVHWFRASSPYIQAHRGGTFVLVFGGEELDDPGLPNLLHDIVLLHSLGIRLVLVHGTRPQIEARLRRDGAAIEYANGLRITDDAALACVKEAAGAVRVEIEARLSMGPANAPGLSPRQTLQICSGNFVTARPLGIRDGIDFQHTGEVRGVQTSTIAQTLDRGSLVLLSPIGYSPTGEVFNLGLDEVGSAVAIALKADKLLRLMDGDGLLDPQGQLIRQLTPGDARALLSARRSGHEDPDQALEAAINACRNGVRRAHLISRHDDGALLRELFTRNGCGTLITAERYETLRRASIADVGGLLKLIEPLEQEGILVRRSREHLEMEIEYFRVIERDDMIVACAALYPHPEEAMGELAGLAVHPDYRGHGLGAQLLEEIQAQARGQGLERLFILTTRTTHWFRERGFQLAEPGDLPAQRQGLYNYQRRSKVLMLRL